MSVTLQKPYGGGRIDHRTGLPLSYQLQQPRQREPSLKGDPFWRKGAEQGLQGGGSSGRYGMGDAWPGSKGSTGGLAASGSSGDFSGLPARYKTRHVYRRGLAF